MHAAWRWLLLASLPFALVLLPGLLAQQPGHALSGSAIMAPLGGTGIVAAAPGRADAENTFIISGVQGAALRLLSRSLDMDMGVTRYAGRPVGHGRWQVTGAEVPMVGRWGITVQVRRNNSWVTLGQVAYAVPFTGTMRLIAQDAQGPSTRIIAPNGPRQQ